MEKSEGDQRWFVVVNPNAGNGKGKRDWNRIAGLFQKNNIEAEFRLTERKGDAIEFTREAIAQGFRKIASVGGDGTLNEIVNGAFTQDYCLPEEITLAMIPVGTGNDWGRMFGIPLVYDGAVEVLREGKSMLHDIGIIDYYNGEAKERRYFINIAGLGFESMVVKKTNRQKDKGKSNKAIYFYNLLSSLISYKNTPVEITIDGRKNSARVFSVNIGNGRYCGGGMRQTPEAVPDDGLLDVTVIREMGRLEIIKSLNLLYNGTILSHPKVDAYRGTSLKIVSESQLFLEADGESLGHTPAEIGIIPLAINIIYTTRLIP